MDPATTSPLPTVVLSSVVRSTYQGESHGGVYLVDLASGAVEQKLDWNDPSISWEGRGADRGLRGIAFRDGDVYLAASDEIFVFDPDFRIRGSFRNRYLKHCHEISIEGGTLFATSTGFDAVLELDLASGSFRRGWCLRFDGARRSMAKVGRRFGARIRPSFSGFDPNGDRGPAPGDSAHVNNAWRRDGTLFVSGVGLGNLWAIRDGRMRSHARIPFGSHNARPFRDGVLLNHTETDRIAFVRRGRVVHSYPLPHRPPQELENAALPRDLARPAFGRGLTVFGEDVVIGGCSPATVTAYRFDPPEVLASVTVTRDVRNAVHGLEIWPFGSPA